MSEASQLSTTRRSVLLGSIGSLTLVVPAGVCAPEALPSDTSLIALGREYARVEQQQEAIEDEADRVRLAHGNPQSLNEQSDAITERMCDIVDEATALHARTLEGVRAKVRIAESGVPYAFRGPENVGDDHHRLAWSIIRDVSEMQA